MGSFTEVFEHGWKAGDQTRLSAMGGCLEKLSTSLLQVHRIRGFHQDFIENALLNLGKGAAYAALRGDVACVDFESLLLQGRAALDRLTWFVAREYKQSGNSFRRISGILENFKSKSEQARSLLNIVLEGSPRTTGLLVKIEGGDSFRDFVAHKGATTEKMTNCLGITYLDNERAILLDCELDRFPLFRTSFEAVKYLSFTVLNTLAASIGQAQLPLSSYECNWRPQTAVLSEFVLLEPENRPHAENHLAVVKHMHPDGLSSLLKT